jgi:hypothetical protein
LAKSRFVLQRTISVLAAVEQTMGKSGSRIWRGRERLELVGFLLEASTIQHKSRLAFNSPH